jgi:hypothetical protein
MAHLPNSSEDFIRRKAEEIDLEDGNTANSRSEPPASVDRHTTERYWLIP